MPRVIDGFAERFPRGTAYFGLGSVEVEAPVELRAGVPVEVVVEFSTARTSGALRVGLRPPEPEDLLRRAEAAAAAADVAVLVVGTTGEWESEGDDRPSMDLPGHQDELIRRVLAANPDTVVVLNAASPVTMDWAAGRPRRAAHLARRAGDGRRAGRRAAGRRRARRTAAHHDPDRGSSTTRPTATSPARTGTCATARACSWATAGTRPVACPCGSRSATAARTRRSSSASPSCPPATFAPGERLAVRVAVTNTGERRGAEVVQCYVSPPPGHLVRPPKELGGFGKVWLDPGETATVEITLDERSFAYWDPGLPERDELAARATAVPMAGGRGEARPPGWRVDPGRHELHVGTSSAAIAHVAAVEVTVPAGA